MQFVLQFLLQSKSIIQYRWIIDLPYVVVVVVVVVVVFQDGVKSLTKVQSHKMYKFLLKIQDEKVRNVCMDELMSSIFCPCGYYVACARCARKLDKYPVCRELIGYVQFVYTVILNHV